MIIIQTEPHSIVKLIKNFRSHPDILSFPNSQFYMNELLPCGDPAVTHSYINWPHLMNRKFPILFHAVSGEDQREASSPSFFNIAEASQVKEYVDDLLSDKFQLRMSFSFGSWKHAKADSIHN